MYYTYIYSNYKYKAQNSTKHHQYIIELQAQAQAIFALILRYSCTQLFQSVFEIIQTLMSKRHWIALWEIDKEFDPWNPDNAAVLLITKHSSAFLFAVCRWHQIAHLFDRKQHRRIADVIGCEMSDAVCPIYTYINVARSFHTRVKDMTISCIVVINMSS